MHPSISILSNVQEVIFATILMLAFLFAGCSNPQSAFTEKEGINENKFDKLTATSRTTNKGATIIRETLKIPFPPIPGVDFVPVPAPCLGLGEPLRMSGIWTIRRKVVTIPKGRLHITEKIDYSEITLKTDELTWIAGPGASEIIVQNLPLTIDDFGEAAFNVRHEFHARFISQNGLPDLQVSHRVRELLGPDGELRKSEFVPFTTKCIGG